MTIGGICSFEYLLLPFVFCQMPVRNKRHLFYTPYTLGWGSETFKYIVMGEDENIALVNVKEANSGCGPPVSELYRQMSRQSPKVYIFLDWKFEKTFTYHAT